MVRARSGPKSQLCDEFVKGKGIFFGGPPGGVRERSGKDPGGIQEARRHSNGNIKKVLYFQCLFDVLELMMSKMFTFRWTCDKSEDKHQWNYQNLNCQYLCRHVTKVMRGTEGVIHKEL